MFKRVVRVGGTLLLVAILLLRLFLYSFVFTSGSSMYPTISDCDCLLLRKYGSVERGDIVSIHSDKLGKMLCKRVVAISGDKVEWKGTTLYVNDKKVNEPYINNDETSNSVTTNKVSVGNNEVYVLGDNRGHSTDSRMLGVLKESDISGIMIKNLGNVGMTRYVYCIFLVLIVLIFFKFRGRKNKC